MINSVLDTIKSALEKDCPYEVRLSHSSRPVSGDRPFLIVGIDSIASDTVSSEDGRVRCPLTAVVSVTAAVPVSCGIWESRRIAAAYILPLMADTGFGFCGFSENGIKDKQTAGFHTLELKFRVKGVYTAVQEEEK